MCALTGLNLRASSRRRRPETMCSTSFTVLIAAAVITTLYVVDGGSSSTLPSAGSPLSHQQQNQTKTLENHEENNDGGESAAPLSAIIRAVLGALANVPEGTAHSKWQGAAKQLASELLPEGKLETLFESEPVVVASALELLEQHGGITCTTAPTGLVTTDTTAPNATAAPCESPVAAADGQADDVGSGGNNTGPHTVQEVILNVVDTDVPRRLQANSTDQCRGDPGECHCNVEFPHSHGKWGACECDDGFAQRADGNGCTKSIITKCGCTCAATTGQQGDWFFHHGCARIPNHRLSGKLDLPWCATTDPQCAAGGALGAGADFCGDEAVCPPHSDPHTCTCDAGYHVNFDGSECVRASAIAILDGAALLAAFMVNPRDQARWSALQGWKSGTDPCEWDGVFCGNRCPTQGPQDRVCAVSLNPSNGGPPGGESLRFKLGSALGNLTELMLLDLGTTQLYGTLPKATRNLVAMTSLQLYSTVLSGTFPNALDNLTSLQHLSLRSIPLSGTLPPTISNLTSLHAFDLSATLLSGTLPEAVSNLISLQDLSLRSTRLSGTLSPAIGKLTSLHTFDLSSTLLAGSLPTLVHNLALLQKLDLHSTSLSGSFPEPLGGPTLLQYLDLSSTLLSGTLPESMGDLATMRAFNMYLTPISGTLPATVDNLRSLNSLALHTSLLSGTVPDLSHCAQLIALDLHNCALTALPPALPRSLLTLYLANNPISTASARELGVLLYNNTPNLDTVDVGFYRNTVLLAPDRDSYRGATGTRVAKPIGCTVGGSSCAFRLDLVDIYNNIVHVGHAERGLMLGLGDLRARMVDLGNGSVLAPINMSWIDSKGPRLFHFYDGEGREFQPIVNAMNVQEGGPNCSNNPNLPGDGGACPSLRTVDFGPRADCAASSHIVADAATGAQCVCAVGFPVPYSGRNNASHTLACHVPCSHGAVPSHDGNTCICTGSNYDSEMLGTLVCMPNEWSLMMSMDHSVGCLSCPDECATCKDGVVTLRAGWRLNASTIVQMHQLIKNGRHGRRQAVFRCPSDAVGSPACPATVLNSPLTANLTCLNNHAGILCASCAAGYSLRAGDNSCAACHDESQVVKTVSIGWTLVLLAAMVAVVILVVNQRKRLRRWKEELLTPAKIILGLLQVLTMLRLALNVVFPPETQRTLSFASVLAVDVRSLFYLNCELGWYQRWLLVVVGIPVTVVAVVGLHWMWQRRTDVAAAKRRAIDRLLFVVLLLYPQVSQQIFSALRCRRLGESLVVLEVDYTISCETNEYANTRLLALILVALVPLGIPLGLLGLLRSEWRASRVEWESRVDGDGASLSLARYHQERMRAKGAYEFCTDQYQPECWYWEPVDMLRKLSLTGLLQLVQRGSAFQVMLGCSISCVFAIMQQRVLPYARAEANALKTLVEGEIFLTFLITFILRTESINTEYFGPSFYGSLLIVSLLLVVLGSVGIVAKQACRKRQFGTRLLEGIEFENVTTTGGGGNLHEMPSIVSMQHATTASPPSRP